jgi:hypothetical protein
VLVHGSLLTQGHGFGKTTACSVGNHSINLFTGSLGRGA